MGAVQFLEYVRKLDLVRTGKMELPGVTKSVSRAVGGIASTDTTGESGRPQIFDRRAFRRGGF